MSRFENLKKACGGSINPESLEEFEKAMREYKEFMGGMRELFGSPASSRFTIRAEGAGSCSQ